ncbi:MAG: DUF6728 family protein [Bacteroidia bacterium]
MIIQKFISYLMFWKKDKTDNGTSFNLKMMHRINKISILMFIIALLIMLYKFVIR